MPEKAVEIKGLSKSFGKVKALDNISLEVFQGEIFGLAGDDGSGKTTLSRIIASLCPFDSGSCTVLGKEVQKNSRSVFRTTALVHASFPLYDELTIDEHIKFHAELFNVSERKYAPVIEPVYKMLAPFAGRRAGQLSGGMRQKLALCCALVHLPRLLILDEPTTGIDAISRMEFWDLIEQMNRDTGITIIVSTPYESEIGKCHRVAHLESGRIKAITSPGETTDGTKVLFPDITPNFDSTKCIEVNNLTRKFGNFTAVDNISFDVCKGEVFGFLGTNGAGKTTAIKMLCGLLRPTSGSAAVAGYDISTQAKELKSHIGYMSQKMSLYPTLTVKENLQFFAGIHGFSHKEARNLVNGHLERMGMADKAGRILGSLPLGWKQRVAFATATLHQPKVVFLDEPTSGVDAETCDRMWETITSYARKGSAILVTTHNMDEAMYCDRQCIMVDGSIKAMGHLDELVRSGVSPDFFDVFDLISSPFRD